MMDNIHKYKESKQVHFPIYKYNDSERDGKEYDDGTKMILSTVNQDTR